MESSGTCTSETPAKTGRGQYIRLTPMQKLHALSQRFYGRVPWEPAEGDYYTTSRADLELYRIVKIEEGRVFTQYCHQPEAGTSEWAIEDFTSEKIFGYARCHVAMFILHNIDNGGMA